MSKSLTENSTLLDHAEFIEQGSAWAGVESRSALRRCLKAFDDLVAARDDAERKAWDSLGRYKFQMFGYWAGAWVKFNRLLPADYQRSNPWRDLVKIAKSRLCENSPDDG